MDRSSASVIIIQPLQIQRVIWQQVLKSQGISITIASPQTAPSQTLSEMKRKGVPLPSLLIIERQLPNLNPQTFCQWCYENFPDLKVLFHNGTQKEISPSERQALINDGAIDLLPAFQVENLTIGVIAGVKAALAALEGKSLQKDLLVSTLIELKRELESGNWESFSLPQAEDSPKQASTNVSNEPKSVSPPVSATEDSPKKANQRRYRGAAY